MMSCMVLQWVATFSAAVAPIFGYVTFEKRYRNCVSWDTRGWC